MVILDPVRSLQHDFVFHSSSIWEMFHLFLVTPSHTGCGRQRQGCSTAASHQCRLSTQPSGDLLPDSFLQLRDGNVSSGGLLHGLDHLWGHDGAAIPSVAAACIDEGTEPQSFVNTGLPG